MPRIKTIRKFSLSFEYSVLGISGLLFIGCMIGIILIGK
jgi:hypothetical protein